MKYSAGEIILYFSRITIAIFRNKTEKINVRQHQEPIRCKIIPGGCYYRAKSEFGMSRYSFFKAEVRQLLKTAKEVSGYFNK